MAFKNSKNCHLREKNRRFIDNCIFPTLICTITHFSYTFFQFHNYLHIFEVCKQLRPQTTSMLSPKWKRQQSTEEEKKTQNKYTSNDAAIQKRKLNPTFPDAMINLNVSISVFPENLKLHSIFMCAIVQCCFIARFHQFDFYGFRFGWFFSTTVFSSYLQLLAITTLNKSKNK